MWEITSYENFTSEMEINVNTNVWVGATFIKNARGRVRFF